MNNKLYVGNLNYAATTQDLTDHFCQAGTVLEAIIPTDRDSGRSRGFGFVTMGSENEAMDAIEKLNDSDMLGRPIKVKITFPKEDRPRRSYDDRGGDRGGYRGGGDRREGGYQSREGGGGGYRGGGDRRGGGGGGGYNRGGDRRGGGGGGGNFRRRDDNYRPTRSKYDD